MDIIKSCCVTQKVYHFMDLNCVWQLFMLTLICLLICLFVIASSAQVSVLIMNVAELELTAVQLSQFSCSPNADGTFVKWYFQIVGAHWSFPSFQYQRASHPVKAGLAVILRQWFGWVLMK